MSTGALARASTCAAGSAWTGTARTSPSATKHTRAGACNNVQAAMPGNFVRILMPSIDMPLDQLRQYKPSLYREEDFESYWETTIAQALRQPFNAELIPYNLPSTALQCYAVRFDGFADGMIAGR